ncbi:MAG: class I SAM-dependent methyltransferase [Flavobacteriaceae bacterium]|nr:class I SAM-dependent methyltransferase [Flavobacteriaceae bacterium]
MDTSDCRVNLQEHWDKAYEKNPTEKLGWFEEVPTLSLEFIARCKLKENAKIFIAGAGSSTLMDALLDLNYTQLIANDISREALELLEKRLSDSQKAHLTCIVDDLTKPTILKDIKGIELWYDRAVVHFFLKKEEQQAYFNLIQSNVKIGGYVLLAAFALDGAEKCCGLEVFRYTTQMFQDRLGDHFKLLKDVNHTFINPFGDSRAYVYTLFQRKE